MSTIIKNVPLGYDAAPFTFAELGRSAETHLECVRQYAAELLAEAEQRAIAIYREAQEQGRAAGLAFAERIVTERVEREVGPVVPALREAIMAIAAAKTNWLEHWEKAALDVSLAIAARVIRREVERHPEITLSLVREALELAAGSSEVELRMHPDDLSVLGAQVQTIAQELGRLGHPRIVADASIVRGACRADTRFGAIDLQFDAQLARIAQELS